MGYFVDGILVRGDLTGLVKVVSVYLCPDKFIIYRYSAECEILLK